MKLHATIPCGEAPYAVDKASDEYLLSITRKLQSTDKISTKLLESLELIELEHSPRTAKANNNNEVLISGANKILSTVLKIPKFEKLLVVGTGRESENIQDYGGNNASGHEAWLYDNKRFFQLDRIERKVIVFDSQSKKSLWELNTPTTPHHVLQDVKVANRYYIACEGNRVSLVPPSLIAVEINDESRKNPYNVLAHTFLPVDFSDYELMGGHHVDQQPNGTYLYMGSAEGYCYIINSRTLQVVRKLPTGKGHGHTGFVEIEGSLIGVAINHKDLCLTLIDTDKQEIIEQIALSSTPPVEDILTQGHTTGVLNGKFYIMVSHEARFVEIDISKRKISRVLDLKSAVGDKITKLLPLQGTFLWDDSCGKICTDCH